MSSLRPLNILRLLSVFFDYLEEVTVILTDHLLSVLSKEPQGSLELQYRNLNDSMELEEADIAKAPNEQPVVLVQLDILLEFDSVAILPLS